MSILFDRVYSWQVNEYLTEEVRKLILLEKAWNYFNYIDPNIINRNTQECINFGDKNNLCSIFYSDMNYYPIDPYMYLWSKTYRQNIYFKEIEYVEQLYWNSKVKVGVVINQERAMRFNIQNGLYRRVPLNQEYDFVCVYGVEQKKLNFNLQFKSRSLDGIWFYNFERKLANLMRKYLINTSNIDRMKMTPLEKSDFNPSNIIKS